MKTVVVTTLWIGCLIVALTTGAGAWYSHAFLWDSANGMQDLGTLGGEESTARGINDSGQVVGVADIPERSPILALLFGLGGLV